MMFYTLSKLSEYRKGFWMAFAGQTGDHKKGQALVEYVLILALLVLVVLAAMTVLAPTIGNVFSRISGPMTSEEDLYTAFDTPTPTSSPTPAWVTCAGENQFCDFSGTALVRYGAEDSWYSETYTDGVWCTNSVFGDPLVGTVKSCQISGGSGGSPEPSTPTQTATPVPTLTPTPTFTFSPTFTPTLTSTPVWTFCANENQFCGFSGTAVVRYGAYDTWVTGTYTNGVLCANSVFGDPLYGIVKSCSYSQ